MILKMLDLYITQFSSIFKHSVFFFFFWIKKATHKKNCAISHFFTKKKTNQKNVVFRQKHNWLLEKTWNIFTFHTQKITQKQ